MLGDEYGARCYATDGTEVVLDNAGERPPRLYKVVDETTNPRTMACHDGRVLLDGDVVTVEYEPGPDGGYFQVHHHWTGLEESYLPGEHVESAAKLLERLERRDD